MENKTRSIIVPFVGGGMIKSDENYYVGNKFYWLPITESHPSNKFYTFEDIKNIPKDIPELILNKAKSKKFHYDPLILNHKTSSYGEPIPSKRNKSGQINKYLIDLFENSKIKKRHSAKIFFGAKFKPYSQKNKNNKDKNTGLFLIGGINIKYMGERDYLMKKFPNLRSVICANPHQMRKNSENFFILIGDGFWYKTPIKFASWREQHNSSEVIKSLGKGFRKTGRARTSVHLGKFDRDLTEELVKISKR